LKCVASKLLHSNSINLFTRITSSKMVDWRERQVFPRLGAIYHRRVPTSAWCARHDVALSPLTALHELGRVRIRKVEQIAVSVASGARVVGTTVVHAGRWWTYDTGKLFIILLLCYALRNYSKYYCYLRCNSTVHNN